AVGAAREVDGDRHRLARVSRARARRREDAAGIRHVVPAQLAYRQGLLDAAMPLVESVAGDRFRPDTTAERAATLEDEARRPQRRWAVEDAPAVDAVGPGDVDAVALDAVDDAGVAADLQALRDLVGREPRPALEHDHARAAGGQV